ncbi:MULTISPECIES: SH3 domain-containing protein [Stenotrophomonas]|uniref:XAC2610-related protein n=1 Tax=Stenotrophomonas TaxID=40323 RepID=UPI00201D0CF9|nr:MULTISPECIES: SH3 domain-containing protein [Stenotrophomonas]MBN5024666.1 SH3 domain-containing protein [Stenotrophomonas maltophilia]MDH1273610.1 SH3 domain-containing protein [Stenotrophomonas sp. GD03937]MDH1485112.1 SH3 domain-containing protein [Stenotrophomonas sp. GD03712]UQY95448.1 SH3 domain-containing protein [Stenotrophomonas maltophilia]WON67905.1 SH3 domain-containing protein [Stenotrophomonas maltophilia]
MKHRECVLGVVLAGLLAPWAQARGDDGETLRFQVAAHVQAQADPQQDGSIAVRFSPSGKRQSLAGAADADGNSRWSLEDVDFDGYPELVARASVGMVNEAVAVYRFDPGSASYRALQAETHGNDSCVDLMGLSVDAKTRTLTSSCRSGPMWYTDQYRFAGAKLYLYRGERLLMLGGTLNAALHWVQTDDQGPLAVWRTYDPAGHGLESAIADGLGVPPEGPLRGQQASVLAARVFLFDRPGASSTKRYLVQGDRVEMLDEQDGWMKLRYRNPKQGVVEGWINVND